MTEQSLARRNAVVLALAAAIVGSAAPIIITLGGLVGFSMLDSDKSWATLPVATFNIGVALGALPAAMIMKRYGRKSGFIFGTVVEMCALLLAAYATYLGHFWLFTLSMVFAGNGVAFAHQYRFAAADLGDDKFKSRAISYVMAGGIGSAIIGPQTVIFGSDLFEVKYMGTYICAAILIVIGMLILSQLRTPPRAVKEEVELGEGRSIFTIMRQPVFFIAVLCAVSSYALMTFVMTGAPLAMVHAGHSHNNAALGIQWHVLAMFGPSFFTGALIARFGKLKIILTGMLILICCAIIARSGVSIGHFWGSLILLGLGWNFGFIGATSLLTDSYRPEEKNKAQGANDFILFTFVATGSLLAGTTLNHFGWNVLNMVIFPVAMICICGLAWLKMTHRHIK